jgi:hypothetical protein
MMDSWSAVWKLPEENGRVSNRLFGVHQIVNICTYTCVM